MDRSRRCFIDVIFYFALVENITAIQIIYNTSISWYAPVRKVSLHGDI